MWYKIIDGWNELPGVKKTVFSCLLGGAGVFLVLCWTGVIDVTTIGGLAYDQS